MDVVARLHATLTVRETPETVAGIIRGALPLRSLSGLRATLDRIIATSVQRYFGWSSMATSFFQPATAKQQADKARELAELFLGQGLPEGDDPEALEGLIDAFDGLIGKARGKSNFKTDRLDRTGRAALDLSRRRYSKLFRLAKRLETKAGRLREEAAKLDLVMIGKSGLAPRLKLEDLGGDLATAAFVAYYSARMKLRSEFTISGQQKPFDELSAELLKLCEHNPDSRWWAVAHVFPRADVLARLSDQERGQLLGTWFDILQVIADRLDAVRVRSDIRIDTMIVKRGNDSSTWNMLAGAWNQARDHWIALIEALGMEALLDSMLPGKVMRLMAADVAYWHRMSGRGLDPNTAVWAALPPPWLVLKGEASCTREDVERVCRDHGVDPEKSGWSRAKARTEIAAFRPTPELVHGVTVSNPYLATWLRDRGAFSGKGFKSPNKQD